MKCLWYLINIQQCNSFKGDLKFNYSITLTSFCFFLFNQSNIQKKSQSQHCCSCSIEFLLKWVCVVT